MAAQSAAPRGFLVLIIPARSPLESYENPNYHPLLVSVFWPLSLTAVSFAEPTHPPNQHNDSWVGAPGGYVQRWARHEEASGEAWVRACFVYKFLRVFIIVFFFASQFVSRISEDCV